RHLAQRSFFFSSRRRHTRSKRDWSSDVCSSDLKSRCNKTDKNNTDLSETDPFLSGAAAGMESEGKDNRTMYQEYFSQQLGLASQIGRASCRKERRAR